MIHHTDTIKVTYEKDMNVRKLIGEVIHKLIPMTEDMFHPVKFHSLFNIHEVIMVIIEKQLDNTKKVNFDKLCDDLYILIRDEKLMYTLLTDEQHICVHMEGVDFVYPKDSVRGSFASFIAEYEKYLTQNLLDTITDIERRFTNDFNGNGN